MARYERPPHPAEGYTCPWPENQPTSRPGIAQTSQTNWRPEGSNMNPAGGYDGPQNGVTHVYPPKDDRSTSNDGR